MFCWKTLSAWLRWRYRRAVTLFTYAFYICNPLITMIMMGKRETSERYFYPLENAKLQETLAEREWHSVKSRR
jgi:hypothetical protein